MGYTGARKGKLGRIQCCTLQVVWLILVRDDFDVVSNALARPLFQRNTLSFDTLQDPCLIQVPRSRDFRVFRKGPELLCVFWG